MADDDTGPASAARRAVGGTRPGARVVLGVLAGVVWFVAVCTAEVGRHSAEMTGGSPLRLVPFVALLSGLCAAAFRPWGRAWGWGLSSGLAVCMLLGLDEGPAFASQAPGAISIPAIFSVGLGSLTVWTALGVSVALTLTHGRVRTRPAHDDAPRRP